MIGAKISINIFRRPYSLIISVNIFGRPYGPIITGEALAGLSNFSLFEDGFCRNRKMHLNCEKFQLNCYIQVPILIYYN